MRNTIEMALDLALEALEKSLPRLAPYGEQDWLDSKAAITAIKQARSAPAQSAERGEPVAWMYESVCGNDFATRHKPPDYAKNIRPLYTTPPAAQRQWVGLTDEEVFETHKQVDSMQYLTFGKAIEAKLREKNGWYRQHATDGSPCWCEPEISYTNPETGASVIVHKEPQ